ncbi:hypothetical protein Pan216_04880 [Planctomycetes bacterium Pan216]|uniref:Uncharacterized protein n=1 Tax=Kolteria novifilia TaxID=2527975 RepID=A0A518AY48_9BACT|nr:hypothetical protein Pan216_04880 [Planctomycetes bacterium Pan216]
MPRRSSKIPPLLGKREIAHLLFLVAAMVFVIMAIREVRDPSLMRQLFLEEPVDAELVRIEPGPADQPQDERFVQIEGLPEGLPNLGAGIVQVAAIGDENEAPAEVPKGDGKDAFNPLGLVQTEECTEVNKVYLDEVEDEVDEPTSGSQKRKLTRAQLRERKRKSTPALFQLLCVASTTPPKVLAGKVRRDIFITNFYKDPDAYRGTPIHVVGALRRLEIEAEDLEFKNPYGLDKFYRAWIFVDDIDVPIVGLFTQLPEGIEPGLDVSERVSFDGMFLKLMEFKAADGSWYATPMLIGNSFKVIQPPEEKISTDIIIFIAVLLSLIGVGLVAFWYITKRDEQFSAELRSTATETPDFSAPPPSDVEPPHPTDEPPAPDPPEFTNEDHPEENPPQSFNE